MALPAHHSKQTPSPQTQHAACNTTPHTPLTYVGMVLRQHTTPELQHPFVHHKRILVPPESGV
jgi:hypothetical protein